MSIAKPVINSYREVERLPEFGAMTQVAAPQSFTVAVRDEPGNLNGTYYYSCTFVTARGETEPTSELNRPGASPVNQMVDVTLPTIPAGQGITARKVYRNKQSSSFLYETALVGTVNDNNATIFTDNVAEGNEGPFALQVNTTGGCIRHVNSVRVVQADQGGTHFGWNAGGTQNNGFLNCNFGQNAGASQRNQYWTTNFGTGAGEKAVDGFECSNFGHMAGHNAINPAYSLSLGSFASYSATVALNRTALGYSAGYRATSSSDSTHVGQRAGSEILLDNSNTSLGSMAAVFYGAAEDLLTICEDGTYLGFQTKAGHNTVNNEIVIGARAVGSGTSTATIGKANQYFTRLNGYLDVRCQYDTSFEIRRTNVSNVIQAMLGWFNAAGLGTTWELRSSSDNINFDRTILSVKPDRSIEFYGRVGMQIATWHGSADSGSPAGRFHFYNNDATLINGYGADPIQLMSNYAAAITYNTSRGLISNGGLTCKPPTSTTPIANTELTFERTSNTTLTLKLKGDDGTIRSVALTLT